LLDGKFYIGKHQTKNLDDGYFGSGKFLKRAVQKHGKENFKKEILEICKTEEEMNAAEKRLVVICDQSYNLCEGGNGGFGYINKNNLADHRKAALKSVNVWKNSPKWRTAIKKQVRNTSGLGPNFTGKKHSDGTKKKMSTSHNPKSHPKGPRGPYKKKIDYVCVAL
jgi:hypothetical protein